MKFRPLVLLGAAVVVVLISWSAFLVTSAIREEDNTPEPAWIPGERASIQVCVDSADPATPRDDAAQRIRAAIASSRAARPETWTGAYTEIPTVTNGCPVEPIVYRPGETLEHKVDTASDPLLFVFVQPPEVELPQGFLRMPYEMLGGGHQFYEATALLFIAPGTLGNDQQLQAALHRGLNIAVYEPANPDGPPDPNETKAR